MATEPNQTQEQQAPPVGTDSAAVLNWAMAQWLSTVIQKQHILNYNGANLAYNHGRDIANKLGLEPASISPFPASTKISVQQPPPTPPSPPIPQPSQTHVEVNQTPTWQKVAMGAALVAAGAGIPGVIHMATTSAVSQPVQAAPVQPETQVATPRDPSEVGFSVR